MKSGPCPFEDRIRQVAGGESAIPPDLVEHTGQCDECSMTAKVSRWMNRFSALDEVPRSLPSPAVLRFKALIVEQANQAGRLSHNVAITQQVVFAAVAATWAGLLTWKWSDLSQWVSSLNPTTFLSLATTSAPPISYSLLAVILVLGSITAVLAFQTIADE